ncbi:hypothetical protein [Terrihabitans sp. B22-R8]|uniref:hypothetical protein n=1 Tax=Terrihabitans sp. B22-R8 TaxID=3425128 RepID=UPI00403D488D
MRPTIPLLMVVAIFGGPLAFAQHVPASSRLAIGKTGINCASAPCPWRGIVDVDDKARDPLRPMWSGGELPSLAASPEDAARLRTAWDDMACLEIEGAWDGKVLRVDRIRGSCT